jgi:hypothetical protein
MPFGIDVEGTHMHLDNTIPIQIVRWATGLLNNPYGSSIAAHECMKKLGYTEQQLANITITCLEIRDIFQISIGEKPELRIQSIGPEGIVDSRNGKKWHFTIAIQFRIGTRNNRDCSNYYNAMHEMGGWISANMASVTEHYLTIRDNTRPTAERTDIVYCDKPTQTMELEQ